MVDYIQALISECSMYEERLRSQLTEAQHHAPERVTALVDLIHGLRQMKAQLIAGRPKTSTDQYADAMHNQTMQRRRRAELEASVVQGTAKHR